MSLANYACAMFTIVPALMGCASTGAPEGWKVFTDSHNGYSVRYPPDWYLYSKHEIAATAGVTGANGAPPTFAVQASNRSSFYLLVDAVASLPADAGGEERRAHLRKIYLSFCGKDLASAGCAKLSEKDITLAGQAAVEYTWRYPAIQGVVLINKHWCLSKGNRGFFLAATAARSDFDREDRRFFTPMAQSLRLLERPSGGG